MQQASFEAEAGVGSASDNPSDRRRRSRSRRTRTRTTTACTTCRSRRTKCDSRRPACSYCHTHGLTCEYEQGPSAPRSRIEIELSGINQRLDFVSSILQSWQSPPVFSEQAGQAPPRPLSPSPVQWAVQEQSPFQLLGTPHMMVTLGLEPQFMQHLLAHERANPPTGASGSPTLRIIQHEEAFRALSAFSEYVHIWYPILRPGFSDHYIRTISGQLRPGPDSCLVLLVAAIGVLAQSDRSPVVRTAGDYSSVYLEAAMASLPALLVDTSITAAQCLILMSIYYCCLVKPCQAYEYIMMASVKVQNLLRLTHPSDKELHEQIKRSYWAVLLLESELQDQLDAVRSGVWGHNEATALPDGRSAWLWDNELGSSPMVSISPTSVTCGAEEKTNTTQAYFLAEISIRRMLHRCNTAIRTNPDGTIAHAPGVALELQRQLDQWYSYLPGIIRFEDDRLFDFDVLTSPGSFPSMEPLSNFLRVQYYCYKLNIYWPAVYQCIQDGFTTAETKEFAERFFNAYIQLMPTLLTSICSCIVNRWTLCATVFMTTMAALRAEKTQCLKENCTINWERLSNCLKSARNVDRDIVASSPSLTMMHSILVGRLDEQ